MGVTILKWGKPSPLLTGERVVHEQTSFRAVTSSTFPSYKIGFDLPPLWRMSLIVTDRRCILLTDLFHYMTQETVMWYPGETPPDDPETITRVWSTDGLFGRCLEIRTHNPNRTQRWLWSPDLTFRFFLDNPETLEAMILSEMRA